MSVKQSEHKTALLTLLTFYTNNLDPNNKNHQAYINKLSEFLEGFGELGMKAMQRYKWVSKSSFFELNVLIQCIKTEIIEHDGIPSKEVAWGLVQKGFAYGANNKPNWHEFVNRVVDTIGWRNLCLSQDIAQERTNFQFTYDRMLEDYAVRRGLVWGK